jgi:hypothetical protein
MGALMGWRDTRRKGNTSWRDTRRKDNTTWRDTRRKDNTAWRDTISPEKSEVAAPVEPSEDVSFLDQIRAAGGAVEQGLMPWADEIRAAAHSVSPVPYLLGEEAPSYEEALAQEREAYKKEQEALPGAVSTGGEIAGSLLNPATRLLGPASEIPRLGKAATAAGIGFYEGTGKSEAEDVADVLTEGGQAAAMSLGGEAVGAGLGKAASAIASRASSKANIAAEEAMGTTATKAMRKKLDEWLTSGKVREGEIGASLREANIIGGKDPIRSMMSGFDTQRDKVMAQKDKIGSEIGAALENAKPVSSGKLLSEYEKTLAGLEVGSTNRDKVIANFKKQMKAVAKRGKSGEGKTAAELGKLRNSLEDRIGSLTETQRMMPPSNPNAPTDIDIELSALRGALEGVDAEIRTVMDSAKDLNRLKSELGRDAFEKNARSADQEAAKEAYKALDRTIADAVTDKEAYRALNKKYEILSFLDKAATEGATKGSSGYLAALGAGASVSTGSIKPALSVTLANFFKDHGRALRAAGYASVDNLASVGSKYANILVRAAERGGRSSVLATHHQMMEKDEEYRKKVMKLQSK